MKARSESGRLAWAGGRSLLAAMLVLGAHVSVRGDIALLRQKGPWSGTVVAVPGLIGQDGGGARVTMRTANVQIALARGDGDALIANCQADFELANVVTGKSGTAKILVAFPVTGLNSKVVVISGFTVTVDGKAPPLVLRQAISVSKFQLAVKDTPVSGQLEARFAPEKTGPTALKLVDGSIYREAYVWSQDTKPGDVTRVTVGYVAELHPQPVTYFTSYESSAADAEIIPLSDLSAAKWDGQFYFCDYVLLSGSTWEGPIGKETIKVTIDPALKLAARDIRSLSRHPVGPLPRVNVGSYELKEPYSNDTLPKAPVLGPEYTPEVNAAGNTLLWTITGKPAGDLLIAIPMAAVETAPSK